MSVRAAIYARVSSARQREAHTVDSQLLVLRRHVVEQGWTLVGEYIDDGRSAKTGKLDAREGFARLVVDAGAGRFDVLLIVDVDRLTRTEDMHERAAILGPFQRANIKIVTPTGGELDLRTFLGEVYVTLQALVAAAENRKRAERIKAGKARAIAEGRKPAGPTPYGWTYSRASGTWAIDPHAAAAIREALERVTAGESCILIADIFHARGLAAPGGGEWTRHKVYKIVTKRTVLGEWTADKAKRLVIPIPAIVDEATWQAAQDALASHGKRGIIRSKHIYLLEGIATCETCGAPISIRSGTLVKRRGYANPPAYICRDRKLARRGLPRCGAPILRIADVDDRVWRQVSRVLESPDLAERVGQLSAEASADRKAWQADVARYRARLEQLVKAETGIAARYSKGLLGEEAFDLALAQVQRDRGAIERQLRAAEDAVRESAPVVPVGEAATWVARMRELAAAASPEDRQRVVRAVARRPVLTWLGEIAFDLVVGGDPSQAKAAGYSYAHGDGDPGVVTIRVVA